MRVTIQLNGKPRCRAEEVSEVGPDGELAAEAETVELAAAKQLPQPLLRDGGVIAMLAGHCNAADKSSFHNRYIDACGFPVAWDRHGSNRS
jgi:hypothetical protein